MLPVLGETGAAADAEATSAKYAAAKEVGRIVFLAVS